MFVLFKLFVLVQSSLCCVHFKSFLDSFNHISATSSDKIKLNVSLCLSVSVVIFHLL